MTAVDLRAILGAGVFTALLLSNVPDAYACSCVRTGPPREELAKAAAVFEGKVTRISTTPIAGSYPQLLEVELEVTRVWKGDLSSKAVVRTATNSAACGVSFTVGTLYLVYALEYERALLASLCSRTTISATATDELAALGPGHPPGDSPNPTPPGPNPGPSAPASPPPVAPPRPDPGPWAPASPPPPATTGCTAAGAQPPGAWNLLVALTCLIVVLVRSSRSRR